MHRQHWQDYTSLRINGGQKGRDSPVWRQSTCYVLVEPLWLGCCAQGQQGPTSSAALCGPAAPGQQETCTRTAKPSRLCSSFSSAGQVKDRLWSAQVENHLTKTTLRNSFPFKWKITGDGKCFLSEFDQLLLPASSGSYLAYGNQLLNSFLEWKLSWFV